MASLKSNIVTAIAADGASTAVIILQRVEVSTRDPLNEHSGKAIAKLLHRKLPSATLYALRNELNHLNS